MDPDQLAFNPSYEFTLTLLILDTVKQCTLENSEDLNEMRHTAAFHQALHCSVTEIHFIEILTCSPLKFLFVIIHQNTGLLSAVSNVSGNRCESDCRSRGREFDPCPVPYFRRD